MTDERNDTPTTEARPHRSTRHGFWLGVALGGFLGIALGGAALSAAKVFAAPTAAKALHGRFGHQGLKDPETAKTRIGFAAELLLSRVDATEAQTAEVKRIAERTIDALVPLAETHRANRERLLSELTAPSVDRGTLESLRQSEVRLAESLSREVTTALADFAETLTPEQRGELLEMARRFHH